MISDATFLMIFLSFFLFLFYWVFGGVFFAVVALLRLMRLRKARFSCFFTLLAGVCGVGAAYTGLRWAESSAIQCLYEKDVTREMEVFFMTVGCSFFRVLAATVLWSAVLVGCGFLCMIACRSKDRTWLTELTEDSSAQDEEE
ncbi:MAG: hypothetical protein UU48_C0003G0008 [Candidatus Uhrbacteria bacterium GW2011_GWF2_41_16]|uniref:Uncharacterized protein n=2 Tax=Candidatus Uhriibacteriota TaxID=1752732 RepID=A0A0G0YDB6_9BACT|nr:MAG: hypothetical protein UU35_C0003G0008 [Candidatus Uhrbacteria bacterium GW2011_GWC2_41_11]KKR98337.1 MAG: hypothetical protein UU48_C0003G0008 [Candidatus Uhrbacteria bacterium GW2011_GWF2_41_16]HBP00060.1 hypothetical protein [Candidatus Uhrbacteria bacterium]